jgi:hypothetical protein
MTRAFLVPARVLPSAPEGAPPGAGRFDDLRLNAFTDRERVAVLSLDFVLVMESSQGLRDAIRRTTSTPPRQMTRRGWTQKRASAASSPHSNARFAEECQSILSKMIALLRPAGDFRIYRYEQTTNLGARSSNLFGRAINFRNPYSLGITDAHLLVAVAVAEGMMPEL